jgi:hypothetical protein
VDSELAGLLGEPLAGLLFTYVGVPTYRSTSGGRPGAPASVVVPRPGLTPRERRRADPDLRGEHNARRDAPR